MMISQELVATYDEDTNDLFRRKIEEKKDSLIELLENVFPWEKYKNMSKFDSWDWFIRIFLSRFSGGVYTGYMADLRKRAIGHSALMSIVSFSYLVKALSLVAPFTFVLYRGVFTNENDVKVFQDHLHSGKPWSSKGFMSTSYKRELVVDYVKSTRAAKGYIMHIKVKEGSEFMPYNVFSNRSEAEIIFPINSKFIIEDVDEEKKIMLLEYVEQSPTLLHTLESFVEYVDVEKSHKHGETLTVQDQEMIELILK